MNFKEEGFLNIWPGFEKFVEKNINVSNDKEIADKCVDLTSQLIALTISRNGHLNPKNFDVFHYYFPKSDYIYLILLDDHSIDSVNQFRSDIKSLNRINTIFEKLSIIYRNNIN